MNTYKAFGLTIESDIMLNELLPWRFDRPDLVIKMGRVPKNLKNFAIDKPNRKIARDQFYLDIKGIAKYYVHEGKTIIYEPDKDACFEAVKLYLLGSCMGAVLYQRKILSLHGSCINIEGRGILLTGKSGAGKSTIASALLRQGYKLVTDDVAAIHVDGLEKLMVLPSYPSRKLWEDAIKRTGIKDQEQSINRISNDVKKYSVRCGDCFEENPTALNMIFEIAIAVTAEIKIAEITGAQKLDVIIRNSYRRLMPQAMALREWHFQECVGIANKVRIFKIIRPPNTYLENEIADMILKSSILE